MKKNQAVVVTTEFRGVFFGYLDKALTKIEGDLKLNKCRNAISWDRDTKGFLGLAANGPTANCRIGPASPSLLIKKLTSIAECSDKAAKAWEAEPWK